MTRTRFQTLALVLYSLLVLSVVLLSLRATDWQLVYVLDDPLIHLALADSLLSGGFGINPGEFASPSSSIGFPPLLALGLLAGLGEAGPLVFVGLAMGMAIWLLAGMIWAGLGPTEGRVAGLGPAHAVVLAVLLVLSVNAAALPMTGMENGIHLLVSVAVILGLASARPGKPIPPWLPVAIVACALVRFEGFALAIAAGSALWLFGHRAAGLSVLAALAVLVAGWAALMTSLGLPVLPSSVMVKSQAAAGAVDGYGLRVLARAGDGLSRSLGNPAGLFMLAVSLMTLLVLALTRPAHGARMAGLVGVAALAAHLVFGDYGWFGRYEVYALGIALSLLAVTVAPALPPAAASFSRRFSVLVAVLIVISTPYLFLTIGAPAGARNIHEQQVQMRRFAHELFPMNVAVNDLGYVAFRSPVHVLDLLGLGSETARRMTATGGRTPENLRALTSESGSAYAMLYERAFQGAIPPEWCHIATLQTSRITAAEAEVGFHLIDRDVEAGMRAALEAFQAELPAGANLSVHACAG